LLVMIINCIDVLLILHGIISSEIDYKILLVFVLLSPFYALLINLIFIIPCTVFIKMKLNKFV
jgi:hypothetical protein